MEHNRYTLCDYIQMTRIRMFNEDNVDGPRISWILMPISIGGNLQAYFIVMESREFLDYYDEYSIRIAYLLLQSVYEQIVIAQSIGNIGFEILFCLRCILPGKMKKASLSGGTAGDFYEYKIYLCIVSPDE